MAIKRLNFIIISGKRQTLLDIDTEVEALEKKHQKYLNYIITHEFTHFIEKKYNKRFKYRMDE